MQPLFHSFSKHFCFLLPGHLPGCHFCQDGRMAQVAPSSLLMSLVATATQAAKSLFHSKNPHCQNSSLRYSSQLLLSAIVYWQLNLHHTPWSPGCRPSAYFLNVMRKLTAFNVVITWQRTPNPWSSAASPAWDQALAAAGWWIPILKSLSCCCCGCYQDLLPS